MKLVLLSGKHNKVNIPKIDQLEDKLLSKQSVSITNILEAKIEFYSLSSRKAVYLLKLHPTFSQWLLLQEFSFSHSLGAWFYSFSLVRRLAINHALIEDKSIYEMIEDDLIEYKLAIAMLDAIEDELLEKGLNRELKHDHIR